MKKLIIETIALVSVMSIAGLLALTVGLVVFV